jgi:hypothetical protein
VVRCRRKRPQGTFHSTRSSGRHLRGGNIRNGAADFDSSWAIHTSGYHPGRSEAASSHTTVPIRTSQVLRILSAISDTKFGTRGDLTTAPRTPGLTGPGTFPSRRFSHPQGFAPSSLLRSCFIPQPLIGFPSLVLVGIQSTSLTRSSSGVCRSRN